MKTVSLRTLRRQKMHKARKWLQKEFLKKPWWMPVWFWKRKIKKSIVLE